MFEWLIDRPGGARPLRGAMTFYPLYFIAGTLVARVRKTFYVRLKPRARQA